MRAPPSTLKPDQTNSRAPRNIEMGRGGGITRSIHWSDSSVNSKAGSASISSLSLLYSSVNSALESPPEPFDNATAAAAIAHLTRTRARRDGDFCGEYWSWGGGWEARSSLLHVLNGILWGKQISGHAFYLRTGDAAEIRDGDTRGSDAGKGDARRPWPAQAPEGHCARGR